MEEKNKKNSPLLRYSGLGVQLLVTGLLFGWVGYTLDDYLQWKVPVFLLLFLCLSLGAQLYTIYRNFTHHD